jgi:hypothetical protein
MRLAFLAAMDGVAVEGERMSAGWTRQTMATLAVLLLLLVVHGPAAQAESLSDDEFSGYLTWLRSLLGHGAVLAESAGAARLYPYDLAGDDPGPATSPATDPLIVASRSLIDLEHDLRKASVRRRLSAQDALTAARLYGQAAEYDSALGWYGRAEALDAPGSLRPQIIRESLIAAVALGDSATVARRVLGSLAGEPGETEIVVALRYLIAHGDDAGLGRLVAATAPRTPQSQLLTVWLAYAHSTLGDWPACLAGLRALLAQGEPAAELSAPLRAWVLVAVPDMLFLAGDHEGAVSLYRALSASEIPGVAVWARLQVANLDLLGGRYADAGAGFTTLCADEAAEPWRAFACEMAKHNENLTRFGAEAKADGIANDDDH